MRKTCPTSASSAAVTSPAAIRVTSHRVRWLSIFVPMRRSREKGSASFGIRSTPIAAPVSHSIRRPPRTTSFTRRTFPAHIPTHLFARGTFVSPTLAPLPHSSHGKLEQALDNALSSTHSVQISFDQFETFAKISTFVFDNVVIVDGNGAETLYNGKIGRITPQFGGSLVKVRFQSYFNQNWPGFAITSTLVPTRCK